MELGSVHSAATSESGRMYEIMEGNPKITVTPEVALLQTCSHPAELAVADLPTVMMNVAFMGGCKSPTTQPGISIIRGNNDTIPFKRHVSTFSLIVQNQQDTSYQTPCCKFPTLRYRAAKS
jgi:hypothetical protein